MPQAAEHFDADKGACAMNARGDVFELLKRTLRTRLSPEQRAALKQRLAGPLPVFYSGNLRRLAQIYGSDKWDEHWYWQHYEHHFAPLRNKNITLLEIGIGGYGDPKSGGGSLRMWRSYFPKGRICGIDIVNKNPHDEGRIHTFQGDQGDEEFLKRVVALIGKPDIIIDDGSHINKHVSKTFHILFPLLADRGLYVVEDTQTSYWPNYGGSSEDLLGAPTSMCMLEGLVDGINHAEFIRPGYQPSYFDQHIVSMHFYHNIVFVYKGLNDEGSNMVQNNMPPA
jgi:hypothetical protein